MLWSEVALVVDLVMLELDGDGFYVEEPLSAYCYHLIMFGESTWG